MSGMDCFFSGSSLYIFSELWKCGKLQARLFSVALQPQRDCPLSTPNGTFEMLSHFDLFTSVGKSLKRPIKTSCYRNTGNMNWALHRAAYTLRRADGEKRRLFSFSTMNLGQEVSVKTISLVHEASSMVQLASVQTQSSLNSKINVNKDLVRTAQ
jgi:hypothetical protein